VCKQKNHNSQSQDKKQFGCFLIHMYTYKTHQQNTFHGEFQAKMWQQKLQEMLNS